MIGKIRKMIEIDEDLCDGCAQCIPNCPEGALQIIDGKARLVSETSCDGLGACLGHCPTGALKVVEREAEPYAAHHTGECPGSRSMYLSDNVPKAGASASGSRPSELRNWPVQLHLINPDAPYLEGADLLLAADCVPFAMASFHEEILQGRVLIILCPKLDKDSEIYIEKLAHIFATKGIKSITIAHMEVPCCFGILQLVKEAQASAGTSIPINEKIISIRGQVKK